MKYKYIIASMNCWKWDMNANRDPAVIMMMTIELRMRRGEIRGRIGR